MSEYKAPLRDMHFVLQELAGLAEIAKLPGCEEINAELVDQILESSAKFARTRGPPMNPVCAAMTSKAPSERSVSTTNTSPNGVPWPTASNNTAFIVLPGSAATFQRR